MSQVYNIAVIMVNLVKGLLLSGWDTARVILLGPGRVRSGIARFPYGELDDRMASLLGVMITVTPGSTTVLIDLERRELALHLLDLDRRDATLAEIQRDLVTPLLRLSRGQT